MERGRWVRIGRTSTVVVSSEWDGGGWTMWAVGAGRSHSPLHPHRLGSHGGNAEGGDTYSTSPCRLGLAIISFVDAASQL